jgi:hypothetical protein
VRWLFTDNNWYGVTEIHFTPFGDARPKIEFGEIVKDRETYFAIYQALAEDERRAGLFWTIRRTSSTSSSLMNVTGGARRTTARGAASWSTSKPAYQLGMTATPLREDNRDPYLDIDRLDEARKAALIFVFYDDIALTRR